MPYIILVEILHKSFYEGYFTSLDKLKLVFLYVYIYAVGTFPSYSLWEAASKVGSW